MTGVLSIVAAVLAVSVLIIVHEAGHYFAARSVGMRVERFSIGFGPVLLSFRRGDTLFAISAIPIGGYVSVAGTGSDVAAGDRGAYANKSALRRFAFVLAGPVMNYVAAVLVAWTLLAGPGFGVPDPSTRVGTIQAGKPAEAAGLRSGDRIEVVAGTAVGSWNEFVREIRRHPGEQIGLEVVRADGQRESLQITPRDVGGFGQVGVQPAEVPLRTGALEGLAAAVQLTTDNLSDQLSGFGRIFGKLFAREKPSDDLYGPIGIAQELTRAAAAGLGRFLKLVWTISVGLAVLNLLPFPALDGSRLLFLGYELVTRRRVNERVEGIIHAGGFVVLLILILAVSFGDVRRLLR